MDYKSSDSFEIQASGNVFIVDADKDYLNPQSDLRGKEVTINDEKYIVLGVEVYAVRNPKILKGDKMALLVAPYQSILKEKLMKDEKIK